MRPILLFLLAILVTPAAAQERDGFLWRFQPAVGSKWTSRTYDSLKSVNISQAKSATQSESWDPPQKSESISATQSVCNWDVISRDSAGNSTLKFTLTSLSFWIRSGANDTPVIPISTSVSTQTWHLDLSSTPLIVRISPGAKVLGLSGREKLLALVREKLSGPGHREDKHLLIRVLTNHTRPELVQRQLIRRLGLPNRPTEVGRAYSYSLNNRDDAPAAFATDTLIKREAGLATFSSFAAFDFDSQNGIAQHSGNLAQAKFLVDEQSGTIRELAGYIRSSSEFYFPGRRQFRDSRVHSWDLSTFHFTTTPHS